MQKYQKVIRLYWQYAKYANISNSHSFLLKIRKIYKISKKSFVFYGKYAKYAYSSIIEISRSWWKLKNTIIIYLSNFNYWRKYSIIFFDFQNGNGCFFDKIEELEAENLGIRRSRWDLAFRTGPEPKSEALDPKIEVSDPKN